jgi:hypothetical protein
MLVSPRTFLATHHQISLLPVRIEYALPHIQLQGGFAASPQGDDQWRYRILAWQFCWPILGFANPQRLSLGQYRKAPLAVILDSKSLCPVPLVCYPCDSPASGSR